MEMKAPLVVRPARIGERRARGESVAKTPSKKLTELVRAIRDERHHVSCCWMWKGERSRMEHKTIETEFLSIEDVMLCITMCRVSDDRVTEMGKVTTELVRSSRAGIQKEKGVAGRGVPTDAVGKFDTSHLPIVGYCIQFLRLRPVP